jgi:hypothetical protein
MFRKILLILMLVLFSASLVSRDKVFLDYNFIKEMSDRLQNACKLKEKGKTVKADRELKLIEQELTDYFSKINSFHISKECALIHGQYRGTLECLPNVHIGWAFGKPITETLLETFEDLKDDDSYLLFTDKFKPHSFMNSFTYSNCEFVISDGEKHKIDIFAIPVSIEKQTKKWSAYQGNMLWHEAKAKCESIGMRLPTKEELRLFPQKWNEEAEEEIKALKANLKKIEKIKNDEEREQAMKAPYDLIDTIENFSSYWALHDSDDFEERFPFEFATGKKEDYLRSWKYRVGCIDGKEFQFKK